MNSIAILLSFLPITFSQSDINITEWDLLSVTSASIDYGSIIGYDYTNMEIDIIGGTVSENETSRFDPDTETYITEDVIASFGIAIENQAYTQLYGSDILYFMEDAGTQQMSSIDLSTMTLTALAAKSATTDSQTDAALCIDDAGEYIYSVGRAETGSDEAEIQVYDVANDVWLTTWTTTLETVRRSMACQVYGDTLYLFGGVTSDSIVLNIMDSCDIVSEICTVTDDPFVTERADIEAVRISDVCGDQYVALIGGYSDSASAIDVVEIFNLEDETIYQAASLNTARRYISAVYSELNQRIFVFNGQDISGTSLDTIEVTLIGDIRRCTDSPTTESPTTTEPTSSPSNEPTIEPTTSDPTEATTETPETTESEESPLDWDPTIDEHSTSGISYAILFVILAIICCIIIVCFCLYDRDEQKYGGVVAVAGGGAVAMVPIAAACGKCGNNDCDGTQCQSLNANACNNCGRTDCDGNSCL
eukprot:222673_1